MKVTTRVSELNQQATCILHVWPPEAVLSQHKTTEGVKSSWEQKLHQLHCPANSGVFNHLNLARLRNANLYQLFAINRASRGECVCVYVCVHVCVGPSTPANPENCHIGCVSALFLVLPLRSLPSPNRSAELMEVFPDRLSSLVFASYWEEGPTLIKTWLDIKPPA